MIKMKFYNLCRFTTILSLYLGALTPIVASESNTSQTFNKIRSNPVELRGFLTHFPKGADLHNHIDGAIYAENMISWAAEDGRCIDLTTYKISFAPCDVKLNRPPMADVAFDQDTVNKMIDAYSTRNFSLRQVSGSDQFFSTFDLFSMATIGREGDMLNEVTLRAHRQNTFYLELMQSWGMTAARAAARASIRGGVIDDAILNPVLDDIATTTLSLIDVAEQRRRELQSCGEKIGVSVCNVEVTYLEQVLRTFSRAEVRAQTRLAVKLIERDIRIVGLNFVAREDHPITLRDHRWQMEMIAAETQVLAEEQRQISMHAGELTLGLVPPESLGSHIREAVEVAGATRIGHGVDITYDLARNDLLNRMALDRIAIEINLTSNANILGISGAEHPFNLYRQFKVPLTLSTDDEGVSRIDLTHEYQRAVETYDLSYSDIKELSRNALRYSFQPGESLFTAHSGTGFVRQCKRVKVRAPSISNQCQIFLAGNPKARMQFDLERRFADFEANFN